jgi:hypothetical protein
MLASMVCKGFIGTFKEGGYCIRPAIRRAKEDGYMINHVPIHRCAKGESGVIENIRYLGAIAAVCGTDIYSLYCVGAGLAESNPSLIPKRYRITENEVKSASAKKMWARRRAAR